MTKEKKGHQKILADKKTFFSGKVWFFSGKVRFFPEIFRKRIEI